MSLEELEPEAVGKVLGMRFSMEITERDYETPSCQDQLRHRGFRRVRYTPDESWFGPRPEGNPNTLVYGLGPNITRRVGAPQFSFQTVTDIDCSGSLRLLEEHRKDINFKDLPAHACIRNRDIRAAFPTAQLSLGTEGFSFWYFVPPRSTETGIHLSFVFGPFVHCAIEARVTQYTEVTARYVRASAQFDRCRTEAHRALCAALPGGETEMRVSPHQADLEAVRRCGTFESFFQREPAGGSIPDRERRTLYAAACRRN